MAKHQHSALQPTLSASNLPDQHQSPQSVARKLCAGIFTPHVSPALWRHTFHYLLQLPADTVLDRYAIARLFVQHIAEWRTWLKDDTLLLGVMRRLLPSADTAANTLFRGESWFLFDAGQIGFCWTADETHATRYAQGLNAVESGGVLLKGYAPTAAILAVIQPSPQQPAIYLCDPALMTGLTTLALFPQT